ncbi:hypothetical protein FGO68_gene14745 [Halteria grandinella]|uniref:Uncharacterized protein n=1 Tax=Halteria grandinella TaxID=5974 RepID=A0A8J8T4A0_HALGN|nr:hypothetical protein FGO68_gene14745 [Halteria grandinella]
MPLECLINEGKADNLKLRAQIAGKSLTIFINIEYQSLNPGGHGKPIQLYAKKIGPGTSLFQIQDSKSQAAALEKVIHNSLQIHHEQCHNTLSTSANSSSQQVSIQSLEIFTHWQQSYVKKSTTPPKKPLITLGVPQLDLLSIPPIKPKIKKVVAFQSPSQEELSSSVGSSIVIERTPPKPALKRPPSVDDDPIKKYTFVKKEPQKHQLNLSHGTTSKKGTQQGRKIGIISSSAEKTDKEKLPESFISKKRKAGKQAPISKLDSFEIKCAFIKRACPGGAGGGEGNKVRATEQTEHNMTDGDDPNQIIEID